MPHISSSARASLGQRDMSREGWAALLLATAAVLYNSWVLEFVLPTGLDPRHSYVSELYAADQPFRALFGGIEAACAVIVMAGALLAGRSAGGRWARAGWASVLALGMSSLGDVILPMRCAPSVEWSCDAVHPWHTATSALAHFFLFASMVFFCVAGAGERPRLPRVRRWGVRVLAAALTTAVSTVGPLFGHPGWHGIPQRAHLLLVGVWFVLLAAELTGLGATALGPSFRTAGRHPERPGV
ncbi:DUF998 domain-containing protein [Streptomyces sp. ID38640]|uniref:DUF998 domain-containing protein n=1 Tax=Streptomyces sp. ID38640 TaxID=1265399 RepID=UPI002180A41D|nr:DUF998 domain-containing protein [Streptomyces sp. ID38640]